MKRMHVHVVVEDLDKSVEFYSALFDTPPTVLKPDYAKWMLEDPKVNFAISNYGQTKGLNHLGFQLDSEEELDAMKMQLQATNTPLVEEAGTTSCYAQSDKYWVVDPSGIAWETFYTWGQLPSFDQKAMNACRCGPNVSCAPK